MSDTADYPQADEPVRQRLYVQAFRPLTLLSAGSVIWLLVALIGHITGADPATPVICSVAFQVGYWVARHIEEVHRA